MGKVEITMPKMGESVAEATIIKWLKQEGEQVEAEEAVLEIATDKVDSEIPSPEDGVLLECRFQENDVVKVGDVIAVLEVEGKGSDSNGDVPAEKKAEEVKQVEKEEKVSAPAAVTESVAVSDAGGGSIPRTSSGKFYSPLVRSIAEKENISVTELDSISGSGLNARVTKKDVLSYLEQRGDAPVVAPSQPQTASQVQNLPEKSDQCKVCSFDEW